MNDLEANVLLSRAQLVDPRLKTDADRAIAWADVLNDMSLDDALNALREHQRTATVSVTPAHLRDIVRARRAERSQKRVREIEMLEAGSVDAVPMPAELREAFREDARRGRARHRAMLEAPLRVREMDSAARLEAKRKALDELDALRVKLAAGEGTGE